VGRTQRWRPGICSTHFVLLSSIFLYAEHVNVHVDLNAEICDVMEIFNVQIFRIIRVSELTRKFRFLLRSKNFVSLVMMVSA
jgi:hypothetical protein